MQRAKMNKSQAIRECKAEHPDWQPKQIADFLTQKGIEVSNSLVSTVLYSEKVSAPTAQSRRLLMQANRQANQEASAAIKAIRAARELIRLAGSHEAAKELIDEFDE